MELHVLFIYTLPILLSTVTGRESTSKPERDIRYNNTVILQSSGTRQVKKIFLNTNSQTFSRPNDLHVVYNDNNCKPCLACMERAIKARVAELKNEPAPDSVELHNAIITSVYNENKIRDTRSVDNSDFTLKEKANKDKRSKTKKQKSILVTKYTLNGDVHALKVKETILEDGQSTCEVFNVTNTYPCQSYEGSSLIATVKKSKSKTDKIQTTTEKSSTAALKKRETFMDNSQIPENVMPSFEEYF